MKFRKLTKQIINVIIIYYLFLSMEKTMGEKITNDKGYLLDISKKPPILSTDIEQQVIIDEDYPIFDINSLFLTPDMINDRKKRSTFGEDVFDSKESTARNINVNILNNLPFAELIRAYRGLPEPDRESGRSSSGRRSSLAFDDFNRFHRK